MADARARIDAALSAMSAAGGLVPVGVPRNLQDALRELDRLEGLGRDWQDALDEMTAIAEERG